MDWDLEEGDLRLIARLDAPIIPVHEVARKNSGTLSQLLTFADSEICEIHPVIQMHSQLHLNS